MGKDGNDDENMEGDESESSSDSNKKDQNNKRSKKKKSEPGQYTLTKLRKMLRAVGAANPKLYKELKGHSNKQQIAKIKEILTEKEVDFSNLSDKAIKKLQSEWNLKREMAELGIETSKPNSDNDNGATLSTRRPRRTRNANVSYLPPPKMKFEESDSEEEDNENEDADGDEKKKSSKGG